MRFAQWLLGLAVITVCGVGTFWLLTTGEADRLRKDKENLLREREGLRLAIERLSGEERVAQVRVIDQIRPGQLADGHPTATTRTTIEFVELDRRQNPLPARQFTISDDVIFFDALVIKFDQRSVAAGDALKGKSLALFRRVYGEHQSPADGYPIDPAGDVPGVFRARADANRFEQELWGQFWSYATQPALAAQVGVRVAQGEVVYVPMQKGQVWTLTLQNNGGLNIGLRRPVEANRP